MNRKRVIVLEFPCTSQTKPRSGEWDGEGEETRPKLDYRSMLCVWMRKNIHTAATSCGIPMHHSFIVPPDREITMSTGTVAQWNLCSSLISSHRGRDLALLLAGCAAAAQQSSPPYIGFVPSSDIPSEGRAISNCFDHHLAIIFICMWRRSTMCFLSRPACQVFCQQDKADKCDWTSFRFCDHLVTTASWLAIALWGLPWGGEPAAILGS